MKVSYNWLSELVGNVESPEVLSNLLTMAGLEVESLESLGSDIEGIVIGCINKITRNKEENHIKVCSIDVGNEKNLQIISTAANLKEGQKVPVALPGSKLPGKNEVKRLNIKGLESEGLICTALDFEIDDSLIPQEIKNDVWILDVDAPVGKDFKAYTSLDDIILEIGLTPNRADCLGMINVAREVKALVNSKLTLPDININEIPKHIADQASVEIIDTDLCSRYAARLVKNVKVMPSPEWIQARLRNCGIRPINNVVDVTNYVMLETGQPLHAFDYDLISENKIIVRRAYEDEKLESLDGIVRSLSSDMLVIADPNKAIAIAGVMGGYDTEVTESTQNILLESAHFNFANIRQTSKKLGLRSESSIRFEKGVDRAGAVYAVNRAAQLLALTAKGEVSSGVIDEYPNPVEEVLIELRIEKVNNILGASLDKKVAKEILERLSFEVFNLNDNAIKVKVPTYRLDITQEVDLVEEIARIYGYQNIESTLPANTTSSIERSKKEIIYDKIRQSLVSNGFLEVITYSFINPKNFDYLNISSDSLLRNYVEISNPLSEEQRAMRTFLAPGFLDVAKKNCKQRINNLLIFELGSIFLPHEENALPEEKNTFGILVMGEIDYGWKWQKLPIDFYYCKGILEMIFQELNIKAVFEQSSDKEYLHPGKTAKIIYNTKTLGYIGEVHPNVVDKYEFESAPCLFEIDLDFIIKTYEDRRRYRPIPRYPGTARDLAVIVEESVTSSSVEEVIKKHGESLIASIKLFDVYRGKQVSEGYKSLAYSLYYQSSEKTLTDEEVSKVHDNIRKKLEEEVNAKLR